MLSQKQFALIVLPFFIFLFSCNSTTADEPARIDWDSWGVPHISASSDTALFFAQGWAQMHNHANHILRLYGRSRGRAAEYWGEDMLQNDLLIHTLKIPETAARWNEEQDPELKRIYKAFVDGMNAYADAHPEAIADENRKLLPVSALDVNMHGLFVVFTRFVGGSELGRAQRWPDMGSNTYAIGPARSASGNAMLVQNPHLPWSDEFLFFESHFNLSGRNMYGVTLTGFPGIAIGFNDNLGWSHTDNTIDNSDTYELNIEDGKYLLDGELREFEVNTKTLNILAEDGSMKEQEIDLYSSEHGPVIKRTEDKALALRLVGLDRPNMFLQWWRMINSSNIGEFEQALQMAQIPFWNVMYADKNGEIFYLFNGLVPERASGDWNYWNRIIPEGKSADIWTEVHPYEDLPKVRNPENGWLQNANDPPWTSTIP
ncbi:MAG: penicillin acylase family protein, partial [Cyclobacteriaceae bacterium]